MTPLSLENILTGTGAVLRGEIPAETVFARIERDSRQAQPDDLFIAVRGERFDGHDFVGNAAAAGVTAALVSREWADTHLDAALPLLVVDDPLAALQRLAAWWRSQLPTIARRRHHRQRRQDEHEGDGRLRAGALAADLSLRRESQLGDRAPVVPAGGNPGAWRGSARDGRRLRLWRDSAARRDRPAPNRGGHERPPRSPGADGHDRCDRGDESRVGRRHPRGRLGHPEWRRRSRAGDGRALPRACALLRTRCGQRCARHGGGIRRAGGHLVLASCWRGVQPGEGAIDRRACGRASPGGHRGWACDGYGPGRHAHGTRGTGRAGASADRTGSKRFTDDRRHLQRVDPLGDVRTRAAGSDEPQAGDRRARRHAGIG